MSSHFHHLAVFSLMGANWAITQTSLQNASIFSIEPSCGFERIDLSKAGAAERFAALRKLEPVVFTNGIDNWAALGTWEWEALRTRVGHLQLTSEDVHPGVLADGWEEGMSLSATMDAVSSKPRLLLLKPQSPIVQELKRDLNVPSILANTQRYGPQFSIGGKRQAAVFNAHQENWLAQVFGRKLWMVYSPSILGAPSYADTTHPCQYLDMEYRLEQSHRRLYSCVIHPGEIIFLPEKWPHSTCNLDDYTVGVGYFGAIDNMSTPEQAAVRGSWTEVEALLPVPDLALRSLLEFASEAGHVAVTRGLLGRGADPDRLDNKGRSALHAAAKTGWPETVNLLLQARATPHAKDVDGNLPLLEASYAGHLGVVRLLCRCPAAANHSESIVTCPAAEACASMSSKCKTGDTALQSAAAGGHLPVAKFLFKEGGITMQTPGHGMEVSLAWAASRGHSALIDFLLDNRADINSRSKDGKPAVMWAAKNGHRSAIERLDQRGANLSYESLDEKTALVEAIRRRHGDVVQFLLQRDIPVSTLDRQGLSPLHHAASTGQLNTVNLLLNARASIVAKDNRDYTVVDEAARMDQGEVLHELLRASGKESHYLATKAWRLLEAAPAASMGGAVDSEVRKILEARLDDRTEM